MIAPILMSIESKLQALRELAEKATPGEWFADNLQHIWRRYKDEQGRRVHQPIAEICQIGDRTTEAQANAAFIAASRLALPKLVEFAEGVRERHRGGFIGKVCTASGPDALCQDEHCTEEHAMVEVCRACGQDVPCPDIEALSKLGEGL